MELEAKYFADRSLKEVEQAVVVAYPEVEFVGVVNLPAIYYDTRDGRFEREKSALRVREENGVLIGCFKAITAEERKFVEEEIILDKNSLNDEWYRQLENYAEIQRIVQGQQIFPFVKIETCRRIFVLSRSDLVIEIALDLVNYLEGVAFEERVEVELKKGDVKVFEAFLHQFVEKVGGLHETHGSKYQKAKDLLRNSV